MATLDNGKQKPADYQKVLLSWIAGSLLVISHILDPSLTSPSPRSPPPQPLCPCPFSIYFLSIPASLPPPFPPTAFLRQEAALGPAPHPRYQQMVAVCCGLFDNLLVSLELRTEKR